MFPDLVVSADLLGSGVFGFVQADIKGNIEERRRFSIHTFFFFPFRKEAYIDWSVQGVRARYRDASQSSTTLENLVRSEMSEGVRNGTPCLVRLTR